MSVLSKGMNVELFDSSRVTPGTGLMNGDVGVVVQSDISDGLAVVEFPLRTIEVITTSGEYKDVPIRIYANTSLVRILPGSRARRCDPDALPTQAANAAGL